MTATLFRVDHGGKGSNQAIGAARLGAEVVAPDRDRRGRLRRGSAVGLWAEEGVDAGRRRADEVKPTMTAAILVEAGGDNRIVIVPGALAELTPAHVDGFAEQIAAADVLLVQLEIPLETALHTLDVARGGGRALDPLTRRRPRPHPIAPEADYIAPERDRGARGERRASGRSSSRSAIGVRGSVRSNVPAFPARGSGHDGSRRRVLRRVRGGARGGGGGARGGPLGLRCRSAHGRARGGRARAPTPALELRAAPRG